MNNLNASGVSEGLTVFRQVLLLVGGYAATKGYGDDVLWQTLAGLVTLVGSSVWGLITSHAKTTVVNAVISAVPEVKNANISDVAGLVEGALSQVQNQTDALDLARKLAGRV